MTIDGAPPQRPAAAPASDLRSPDAVGRLFTAVRLAMLVGTASLIVAAVTLLGFGAVETFRHVVQLIAPAGPGMTSREMFLASIKLVDLVLLATILQVVAFAIYAMFIDGGAPLPAWLRAGTVDSLKNKLAGIVVVMLAVLFLEEVIQWGSERDLLPLGLAVAAVVLAVSCFISTNAGKD